MPALKFNQQIATTATKPISVHDLLKRLKALLNELKDLEQNDVEPRSLNKIAAELVSPNLLQHKNKGITAHAACCIADILRLCVPKPPFTDKQLKSIFECFVKQLKGLGDADATYFEQYYYLLESLATVESLVLLEGLDKGDQLTVEFFRTFFDVVVDDQKRQNLEQYMVSIMAQLIDELPQLPSEILEILLAQLIRPKTAERLLKRQESSANAMAKAVLKACADRLQLSVCQYFTDIICDANEELRESEGHEHGSGNASEQLKVAHNLVHELFICAPTTLQNVIPQLENELNVENVLCRLLATQTISSMIASTNGEVLLRQHSSTYKAWASRRNDKSVVIRAKWVEGLGQILNGSDGAIRLTDVEQLCIDGLITRLVDPDERVRSAACHVIENLEYSTAKARLTIGVLKTYSDRCRDRKPSAQEAAFSHIGKLFGWAFDDISQGDTQAMEKFAPLVNYILHCLYVNDMGINVLLERTLYNDLLNCEEPDDAIRARRALTVLKLADEKSRRAFFAIVGQYQKVTAQYLELYLRCCDKFNGGTMDKNEVEIKKALSGAIKNLVQRLPNASTAEADLMLFAEANDRRSYKLMRECISPANDYKLVRKAMKETVKRAAQVSSQVAATIQIIVSRASFQFFNRSIVSPMSAIAHDEGSDLASLSQLVLREISVVQPTVYRAQIDPLTQQLMENPTSISINSIKALAQFARSCPGDMPDDEPLYEAVKLLLTEGSPAQAKQAVTILCSKKEKPASLKATLDGIVDCLLFDNEDFLTQLAVIAQVNLLAPELLEDRANDISMFCAKELLTQTRYPKTEDDTDGWKEDESVSKECMAKCYALRILGNRLRAYHAADTAKDIARPVFKALTSIILSMGELSPKEITPPYICSRLRLEAGKMVLKLACFPVYEGLITPADFVSIALFAQDFEYHVRKGFLTRLQKSLATPKLPSRWHVIMFLTAHDPEDEIKVEIKRRIHSLTQRHASKESYLMESMMPRLIHLLAHHPDFLDTDRDDDDLFNFSTYFCFYFDAIATADNLVLIYHYCQRIKQVADALPTSSNNTENIYILSDIAQVILSAKAEQHNWPLLAYPKKLKLPTDLFRALPSSSDANITQTRVFLSEEQRDRIRSQVIKLKTARPAKVNGHVNGNTNETHEAVPSTPQKRGKENKRPSKRRKRDSYSESTPMSERRSSARPKKAVMYVNKDDSDSISEDESELSDDE